MPGIWSWYGESHRQRKYPGQGYFMMHRLFCEITLKVLTPDFRAILRWECGHCGLNIQKRSWCMSSVFCSGKMLLRQLNFERLAVRVTVEWYSLIFESHIDPSTPAHWSVPTSQWGLSLICSDPDHVTRVLSPVIGRQGIYPRTRDCHSSSSPAT